jgi:hypothetical protein
MSGPRIEGEEKMMSRRKKTVRKETVRSTFWMSRHFSHKPDQFGLFRKWVGGYFWRRRRGEGVVLRRGVLSCVGGFFPWLYFYMSQFFDISGWFRYHPLFRYHPPISEKIFISKTVDLKTEPPTGGPRNRPTFEKSAHNERSQSGRRSPQIPRKSHHWTRLLLTGSNQVRYFGNNDYSHFKKVVTLQKGGNADRRTFRESNAYFARHATTTKQKSEPYQELKQYVIVIFNGLYKIRLSPRHPDNDPDLAIRNNRSYLIEICRITNIEHIFGFNTLFSLLSLENTIRNPSHTFRIAILQIQIVPIRKMSRVQKISKVTPSVITTRSFSIPLYCFFTGHFSWCDWCSNDKMWWAVSGKKLTISQQPFRKYIWVMESI